MASPERRCRACWNCAACREARKLHLGCGPPNGEYIELTLTETIDSILEQLKGNIRCLLYSYADLTMADSALLGDIKDTIRILVETANRVIPIYNKHAFRKEEDGLANAADMILEPILRDILDSKLFDKIHLGEVVSSFILEMMKPTPWPSKISTGNALYSISRLRASYPIESTGNPRMIGFIEFITATTRLNVPRIGETRLGEALFSYMKDDGDTSNFLSCTLPSKEDYEYGAMNSSEEKMAFLFSEWKKNSQQPDISTSHIVQSVYNVLMHLETVSSRMEFLLFVTIDSIYNVQRSSLRWYIHWLQLEPWSVGSNKKDKLERKEIEEMLQNEFNIQDRLLSIITFLCDGLSNEGEDRAHKSACDRIAFLLIRVTCDFSVWQSKELTMMPPHTFVDLILSKFTSYLWKDIIMTLPAECLNVLLHSDSTRLERMSIEDTWSLAFSMNKDTRVTDSLYEDIIYRILGENSMDAPLVTAFLTLRKGKMSLDPFVCGLCHKQSVSVALAGIHDDVDPWMKRILKTFCATYSLKAACCRGILYFACDPTCRLPMFKMGQAMPAIPEPSTRILYAFMEYARSRPEDFLLLFKGVLSCFDDSARFAGIVQDE